MKRAKNEVIKISQSLDASLLMEGELGKEVDSLAQRFNAENPDYKIVPTMDNSTISATRTAITGGYQPRPSYNHSLNCSR